MSQSNKPRLREVMLDLQDGLLMCNRVCGSKYELTLVARYVGDPPLANADILITNDDCDKVKATIDKLQHLDPTFRPGD